jgi:hypothetical protein
MKKPLIVLGILLIAIAGLSVIAVRQALATPKGLTLSQAVSQRDNALLDLKIQKQLNANDEQAVTNLKADKAALTQTNVTLCTQIKAAKLVQPLCK